LLGCHEVRAAQDLLGAGRLCIVARPVEEPGQAQVEHFDSAVAGEHQVGGFYVPVNHAVLVGVFQAQRRLAANFAGVGHWQWAVGADQLRKVTALHELHHQEVLSGGLPCVGGLDDVRMVKPSHCFHFPAEAGDGLGIRQPSLGNYLHGEDPLQPQMPGLIDGAHPSPPKLRQNLVLAKDDRETAAWLRDSQLWCRITLFAPGLQRDRFGMGNDGFQFRILGGQVQQRLA
jgi:hypothetical protein